MKKKLFWSIFLFIMLLANNNLLFCADIMGYRDAYKKIKYSTVAGSWYPGKPEVLAKYLDDLLSKASLADTPAIEDPIRALILPHAGYNFSGATAAVGIKQVMGREYKRVVVLGPAHKKAFAGLSLPDVTHYETPLGLIPLDLQAMGKLNSLKTVNYIPGAHSREHSIEMELPLLQKALKPGWKLVPILVGHLNKKGFAKVAKDISFLLDDKTLLVVSGDFTHYGPNYDYTPFVKDEQIAKNLHALDIGAFNKIVERDIDGFINYHNQTGISSCGFGPLALLINLMGSQSNVHLLKYQTSGELTSDYSNSVSYLSAAITAKQPLYTANKEDATAISKEDMVLLHNIAKRVLDLAINKGPNPISPEEIAAEFKIPDNLKKPYGAFVTLKKEGELRGCIGFIKPIKPLFEAVIDNAINAAFRDHRFNTLKKAELSELEIEISVLSPTHYINSYEEFEVGHHGIIMSKMGREAVFLPEVATEQGWNRDQTLTNLSQKAGLSGSAWKTDTIFKVFTAQKHSAPYAHNKTAKK
ncbi:MAG: AmmeMemoRadiSam system protein B [Magnetococcales bacterium]|nr:AmmeMemoRadiSam system protein B [Magnetococcales bacterium]